MLPIESLKDEEILVLEIAPEIVHFHVPGYLIFLRTTTSFKIWPRNVLHPATISKKSNPAKRSDVSVLPASISERRLGNSMQQLSGANTSPINIYEVHSIKLVSAESIFHVVLKEYPEIIKPPSFSQKVKHNVKHFIETTGSPVFAKARRLAPDRVKIAKS
ncbi:transposon Ty3-I Gag-Pol polyprotein [Nephila pilipes]|uniref:Transposon Ty3-I Gag-Pol polyprotein n=1 Tax=Nephila pilipes TaxID=299642 RepID=A0A8X6U369_NEPPI|nr:transposon Ty3-I Gag-Pol polyprotein [Nephila pilipes]